MATSPAAGVRELGRGSLYLLGLVSTLKALALIGIADALATGIVSVIDGTDRWRGAVALGLASGLLRALVSWAQRVVAARAMLGTKERLRAELAERLVSGGGIRPGAQSMLATRGLDELDKYFTVFLPALVTAASLPLLVGVRILFADWVSALVIVVTVPLIPVFMALIGMHTQERVAEATATLERLSDHLVELARGLPVLMGLGRADEQVRALEGISEDYRKRTTETLRTAFLSSLALELIATISVAVVAVFIGVRLVHGDMPLELGLLALLLAPECFTPLREVGTAFHSSQDGTDALARVRAILSSPRSRRLTEPEGPVRVEELTVHYADRDDATVAGLTFQARQGAVTLLDGASGTGKSTVLAALAGILESSDDPDAMATVSGSVTGIGPASRAWLPQHPRTVAPTVEGELLLYAEGDSHHEVGAVLELLGLSHLADADPAGISPGELRRLAFGRVLLRVADGATVVLLDEPTAHLDALSAGVVVREIAELRGRATVIVASHDDAVRSLAEQVVAVGQPREGEAFAPAHATGDTTDAIAPVARIVDDGSAEAGRPALRELALFLRPVAARIVVAVALGTLAAVFAIGLTAVSAWLIVRASEQPPIMYLLVAIVGVRFFGIGRAVLRYSERLVGHDAIFAALTRLRVRLWYGLAARGATRRSLLSGENALDRLVNDVDRLRDLSLRVVSPVLVGIVTTMTAVIALSAVLPSIAPLFLALGACLLLVAPAAALAADRASTRAEQGLRSVVLRRFASMLAAAEDLRANGVDARVRRMLGELDTEAGRHARRGVWALGLGGAVVVAACCGTAILVLPFAAPAVASGVIDGAMLAVLALVPLGLIDPLLDMLAGVQQWPTLRTVLHRVSTVTSAGEPTTPRPEAPEHAAVGRMTRLELDGVAARWPGTETPVFAGVDARVDTGEWLVVTGPSGSGKSTLLALLLGHLRPDSGRYLVDGIDAAEISGEELRRHVAWCPQEGHLFDSTLRANLLIARPRADAPDEAELVGVLDKVGLGPLLGRLPRGLDTPVGLGGRQLSGGERQRLAVARTLLTRSEVVLVDEPTAHLDEEASIALMADLRVALADRIAVLVTHSAVGVLSEDRRIRLSPRGVGAGERVVEYAVSDTGVDVGGPA